MRTPKVTNELSRRFAARARTTHPAHPLTELPADLLAEYDRPMGAGHLIEIDTTRPVDLADLTARVTKLIDRAQLG